MSAERWRLVRVRPTIARTPQNLSRRERLKRLAYAVLERTRGRLGVWVVHLPGRVVVVAESVDALRSGIHYGRSTMDRRVGRVSLRVAWWRGPWLGWAGRLAPVRHVTGQRVALPKRGRGPATVELRVEWPVPARELVAAAEQAVRPQWPIATGPAAGAEPASGPGQRGVVDAIRVNPRGRRFEADQPDAPRYRLVRDGRWTPGLRPWRHGRGEQLSWPTIAALRGVGALDATLAPPGLLVELATTGVVLYGDIASAPGVAPSLVDILREPLPATAFEWEVRSLRQRREALREHGLRHRPPVSALLATRRPEHLDAILTAIAGQTYPDLEIVLCLHGIDLPEPAKHRLDTCGRPYEVVRVDADVPFGEVLGIATARCGGTLLTKFDDDDTYGPEHVWDLVLARQYSAATLVGKGAEFVYLVDADLTIRRFSGKPEWEDTMVAGGTMLLAKSDLEALGGWRPVPRSVDRGLFDRLNRAGGTIYRTHPLGYIYHRRAAGHTWDPGSEYFLQHTRQRWDGLLAHPEFGTA
jgi:hypothetical protein